MLRCNEPAPPLMSSILYTPHRFGMRDRPDAQENLDTHFHHSSTTHMCTGYMALLFFLESEQAKVTLFIYFSSSLYVSWGRRHGLAGILSRCEKILWEKDVSCTMLDHSQPTYLLTSSYYYYFNYSPYGCDDTRVTWLYIFWEGGGFLAWPALFVSSFGREMRGVNVGLYWCGDTTTVYNLCCLWIMMMDLSTRDGCNTR